MSLLNGRSRLLIWALVAVSVFALLVAVPTRQANRRSQNSNAPDRTSPADASQRGAAISPDETQMSVGQVTFELQQRAAKAESDPSTVGELIQYLISLHKALLSEKRDAVAEQLANIAKKSDANQLSRVAALLLLGGHNIPAAAGNRKLLQDDQPLIVYFTCTALCMGDVVGPDQWKGECDPNAKATLEFWSAALLSYAGLCNQALADKWISTSQLRPTSVFWDVTQAPTDIEVRQSLGKLAKEASVPIANSSLLLLCRSGVGEDTWNLLQELALSSSRPEAQRSWAFNEIIGSSMTNKRQLIRDGLMSDSSAAVRMQCLCELLRHDPGDMVWSDYSGSIRGLINDLGNSAPSEIENLVGLIRNAARYDANLWACIRESALNAGEDRTRCSVVRGLAHPSQQADALHQQMAILESTITDQSQAVRTASVKSLYNLLSATEDSAFLSKADRLRLFDLVGSVATQVNLQPLAEKAKGKSNALRDGNK